MTNLSYSELIRHDTFEDRYNYVRLNGVVGEDTFGFERYLNQRFYRSPEWRRVRNAVISRDEALDLGVEDRPIMGRVYVHHLNPLRLEHIKSGSSSLLDMENLICVSHTTHNAIHYGDASFLSKPVVDRRPGDTKLW